MTKLFDSEVSRVRAEGLEWYNVRISF